MDEEREEARKGARVGRSRLQSRDVSFISTVPRILLPGPDDLDAAVRFMTN
jgi:hypothetical protein